jgi:hypothetical protein
VLPGGATAGSYAVVSCNSAGFFGFNASAWAPYSNAGTTYEDCPTNGGFTAGVSNRMTGQVYSAFSFSGHAFTAPPGTTITGIRWGGRLARQNCSWGTFIRALPSAATVVGVPPGQYCATRDWDNSSFPFSFTVPPGTTRLEQLVLCGASQCDPGAAMHSHALEVRINDPQPPSISLSGPLASGQWVSGAAGRSPFLSIASGDSAGIQRITTVLGRFPEVQTYPCNWSLPRPCPGGVTAFATPSVANLPDGRHTLYVVVQDAAGNSANATREAYVDNTPPDPVLPEVIGGIGWRRSNEFAISWTNPPDVAAPIIRAHWKLCRSDGLCLTRGERAAIGVHDIPHLGAPAPGDYRLHVWLEDAAGNQREASAAVSVPIRYDPEPPELAFLPPDPADPLRVAVNAVDRHSGLASGEIEMRAIGGDTWHGLPTARQGSQLVAYVDDERFRRGSYQFRAHAKDLAGNEASTGNRIDGAAATLRLPARIDTRLRVGVVRKRVRRGRSRIDTNVVARFARLLRLRGRLTNAEGQPLEAASVEALERQADGTMLPLGLATTNLDGKFRYVVRARRNRQLLFRYGGSRRIAPATSVFRMWVPAMSSISVNHSKVRNGEAVVFSGRVGGRPVPAGGKLLEMQAHFRGRWRTFSTLRTNQAGAWRFRYRFGATVGRVTYRFRARLPSEGGYPFISGHSRVTRVVVFGP